MKTLVITLFLSSWISSPLLGENLDREQLLGKTLFFDPVLSNSNTMSCATCHDPDLGWEDGLALGVGDNGNTLAFRTPSLLNISESSRFFWDGRETSLMLQVLGPIQSQFEMNQDLNELVNELEEISGYRSWFREVYPDKGITPITIAIAISEYEKTILLAKTSTPMLRWFNGDRGALNESEVRGKNIFFTNKGMCSDCHTWPSFTNAGITNTGVTGNSEEMRFKTPQLWNVSERGPYMHNGSEKTLEDVIDFYNEGGREDLQSVPRHKIKKLNLTEQDKKDLLNFLKTLSGKVEPVQMPVLPR